ncbi:hypothetical protein N7517_010516 [Penicillium concentricum]|uniref:Uncharacterized protein n=1 Tax=Penicillium concentricum TaxID=293559 RepID=A0A9W9R8Z0_9EURO|nr:uncharacterized protein N7517_010516 [Penicillium concentricum]KAJ5355907.1 hypothetical protein N7517_010516 [Penicillium concentricum]
MRFELVILAHLASSVTGLAVVQGGNKLINVRADPVTTFVPIPSPTASSPSPPEDIEECPGAPGYSYSPVDWRIKRLGGTRPWIQKTCLDKEPSKGYGTDIHVERGCIMIEDSKQCAPSFGRVGLRPEEEPYHANATSDSILSVELYAMFDGNDQNPEVTPPCRLSVQWPGDWRDLDFTAENCITDRSGEWKECCPKRGNNNDRVVRNPYV